MTTDSSSTMKRGRSRAMILASLFLALGVLLAACGGSSPASSKSSSGHGGIVTVVPSPIGDFTDNFNVFSANNDYGTQGLVYETLMFFDRLNGSVTPWLASSYQIASDAKSVTFHLRQGVQWSDGQPFTAQDVVFTLNLLKQYPATDTNGLWQTLQSVSAPDNATVVVNFVRPSSTILWYLAGQTYIVPQHIWSTVGDPTKYLNTNPIGTGPFTLKSFTPQLIDYVRNPHYWQPGKPYVDEVRYPSFDSNTGAELLLDNGSVDWTGLYTPDIQKTYVARNPTDNHYWFPAAAVQAVYLNTAKFPFNLLAVRQAMSLALDRQQISAVGENGYELPASPTGLVLPNNQSYLSSDYAHPVYTAQDSQATALLEQAGFTKGSDGIYQKDGKSLSFNLNVVAGWTDWITDCQIIASNLKAIGMQVTVNPMAQNAYYSDLQIGNYDTAMSWTNPGSTPFYLYNSMLNSANTAPLGQTASSNFERWSDQETDQLLAQYEDSADPSVQLQAIQGLEKIMVEQVPVIPVVYNATWYEYSTARFVGWPDASHTYAVPSPYTFPDAEVVLLNIHQA
jgi:peptide/nickel transport system substrate-binding protein